MTGFRSLAALLSLFVCTLTGCTTLMQGAPPLPEGFTVKDVAKADKNGPFAVSRNGSFAAVSGKALVLTDASGGRKIAKAKATALSFSPSGAKLAAAVPGEKQTTLRLFDDKGSALAETTIPDRVTSLAWRSEGELLATALTIQRFSFGSLLTSRMYSWDGATAPVATTLGDVTVRPALGKVPEEELFKTLNLAVSPYGDEIAYSTLKDPPLFQPFLRIAIRHLETGAEREVAQTDLGSGAPIYAPDGESLLVGDAHRMTRRLTLPDAKEINAWPSPGNNSAISPSGSYVFLDGTLYQDEKSVIHFPEQSRAAFLPDGSGLAVSYDGKLYLVTGLEDQAAPALPADLGRLLKLRRLRSLKLITEQEYRNQKGSLRP